MGDSVSLSKKEIKKRPKDSVFEELQKRVKAYGVGNDDINLTLAMYMFGFSSCLGFCK